ncbi:MAG: hypothetical protein Kow0069_39420 [Promethearchaeota archaeon]
MTQPEHPPDSPDEDPKANLRSGDELARAGRYKEAMEAYEKALQQMLDAGSYARVPDAVEKVVEVLQKSSTIVGAIRRVENVIKKFRQLDLPEETGRLYATLGRIHAKLSDFGSAAECFENAAQFFDAAGPDACALAGSYMVKAGELWEREGATDRGERLVMRGLTRFCGESTGIQEVEREALEALRAGDHEAAAVAFCKLGDHFENAKQAAHDDGELVKYRRLWTAVQARLTHLRSVALLVAFLCEKKLGREEEAAGLAEQLVADLRAAVRAAKDSLHDLEDVRRTTHDLFTLVLVQELRGKRVEDPSRLLDDGLSPSQLKALSSSPFYQLALTAAKVGVSEVKNDLAGNYLGYLERVKPAFLDLI